MGNCWSDCLQIGTYTMNFSESQQILEKINSSNNILLNLHHNPDADSVGSATAFGYFLKSLNKNFKIITSSKPSKNLEFLFEDFEYEVIDFNNFDYSKYDLFIANDSSSWARVSGANDIKKPDIFFINIDHHKSNQKFADINLISEDASANSLLVYKLFKDLEFDLDQKVARSLLTGIFGDTGVLRFPEADVETYQASLELMNLTDKNKIIFNLYQTFEENHVNVWKEILNNLEIDQGHKFVFSFIRLDVVENNNFPTNAKAEISDMIFQSIEGTNFGLVGIEDKDYISVSFRARKDVDVSVLASRLGGGGHKWASAARVWEGSYEKTVEKILSEAIDFAKENV